MRTLQLYATGSATAAAVAQVVIPSGTTIKAVQIALDIDSITDNADVTLEFSKVPSSQIAVNGALDPFLEIRAKSNFVTSGLAHFGVNKTFPVSVPCRQGEIVYVHAAVTGTITYRVTAIIWY